MEVNLYRISRESWIVQVPKSEAEMFTNIEDASVYLMELGVADEAIDEAIISLEGRGHTRAHFGIKGTFIFTDGARHYGLIGVA